MILLHSSCMTQERIDLLDQLGFSWEVRPSLERPRATWQQRLEELQAYHKSYGNFLVDPLVMPQLHAWCHEQRNRLKLLVKNNGKDLSKRMNPERAEALQKIGFFKDTVLLDASAALGKIGGTEEGPLASTSAMTTEETSDAPPATMIASAAPPSMDTIHHSLANKDNSIHLPDADNATVTKPDVSAEEEWKGQEEGPSQQETECGADVTHFVISV